MVARDAAEQHFETYLAGRGISHDYEQPAGDKRPDYWIQADGGAVVCEVHHVTASLGSLPNRSGAFDVHAPLSKAIKRKSAQGRPLEGAAPYVVVLWAPNWPTDPRAMAGAVLGRLQITMPFDTSIGAADPDRAALAFGRDATLHEDERTHISAVAVLRRFNPGLRAAEDEVNRRRVPEMSDEDRIALILEIFGRRSDEGLLDDDDARQPRLVTFHNPYASTPLPLSVLNGPFDEQYAERDGTYTEVFEGTSVQDLPSGETSDP